MEGFWEGIFTIPQTPFTADDQVDEESLRREVKFCLRAGGHGLVAPVVASEFCVLTDEERLRIPHVLVEEADGEVPVIVGGGGRQFPTGDNVQQGGKEGRGRRSHRHASIRDEGRPRGDFLLLRSCLGGRGVAGVYSEWPTPPRVVPLPQVYA